MAELLIRVADRVHARDVARDQEQPRRGDVIVIQPDGWTWSVRELTAPHWRILRLSGVSADALAKWLEPEAWTVDDLNLPDPDRPPLGRRVRRLNLDAALLPAAFKAWLADNARAEPVREVMVGGTALLDSVEVAIPRLRDRL